MRKSFFTRLLSVVLALVIVAVPVSTVLAGAKEVAYEQTCPLIYVHGFMDNAIYDDPNAEDREEVWAPSTENVLTCVKGIIPALGEFMLTRNWDKLADDVLPLCYDLLSPAFLNHDGEIGNTSGIDFTWPEADTIKYNSEIDFRYDWRLDPVEIAAQLNDFIDYVLECSGAEKVSLICHSLGGVIAVSYASIYGYEKLHGVIFNSTAIYGETYTGELMCGKMTLNSDSLRSFLTYIFDETEYEELLNGVFDILKKAGLLDFVCAFGNDILKNLSARAIPEVVVPMFGNWLTIWAMTPDEYIDEGMDYVFNTVYANSGIDHTELISKITRYNELVRKNKTQTIKDIAANCKIGVYSRYGYSSIPVTPSWDNIGDGVVDTKYSSFGATVTKYGDHFSDEYLMNTDTAYISPDKTVDASTCLFPEKTWFIKYLKHSDSLENVKELSKAILYSGEEVTVDTYEEFPRFMKYELDTDTIIVDNGEETNYTGIQKFMLAMKQLFSIFKKLVNMIIGQINSIEIK